MYVPAPFKQNNIEVLHAFVREFGFGTLVTTGQNGLEASHVPMLFDSAPLPYGTILGHIARANRQWEGLSPDDQSLAMFVGPNAYITPSWYETKQRTGKVVPTWNYIAVHAYGSIEFFDDATELRELVSALTRKHEASQKKPWDIADAPSDFIDTMLKAIVGFRLHVSRIEGKWKLGQNRSPEDIAGVRAGLTATADDAHAALGAAMDALD